MCWASAYQRRRSYLRYRPKALITWYESTCNNIVALKEDWTRDAWALYKCEAYITRHTSLRSFEYLFRGDFRSNAR